MIFKCIDCNYSSNRKSSYLYHCGTQKHLEKVKQLPTAQSSTQSCAILCLNDKTIENDESYYPNDVKDNSEHNIKDNIKDNKKCAYCSRTFTRHYSLIRHYNTCSIKLEKEKEEMIKEREERMKQKYELELKLQLQEKDIEYMKKQQEIDKKQIEELKEDKQFHKKVIACESNNLNGALQVNMNTLNFLKTYHTDTPPLKTFSQEFADPYKVYEQKGIKYAPCA